MGLLKLSKLKGMSDFNISHKTDTVEVTIFWKRATPADFKKKTTPQPPAKPTKPPTVKPATKSQQKAAPKPSPKPTTAPKQKI